MPDSVPTSSQNERKRYVPEEDRLARIPVLRLEDGLNWTEVANELGVSRRQIFKDRKKLKWFNYTETLLDQVLEDLQAYRGGNEKDRKFSLVERRKLLTALLPKKIETKVEQIIELDEEMNLILDIVSQQNPELLEEIQRRLKAKKAD